MLSMKEEANLKAVLLTIFTHSCRIFGKCTIFCC